MYCTCILCSIGSDHAGLKSLDIWNKLRAVRERADWNDLVPYSKLWIKIKSGDHEECVPLSRAMFYGQLGDLISPLYVAKPKNNARSSLQTKHNVDRTAI